MGDVVEDDASYKIGVVAVGTAAEFGGYVVASDIDERQARGKVQNMPLASFARRAQYGFAERIFDLFTFDVTSDSLSSWLPLWYEG
ncbi:hypothetical protein JB92DRAFT_3139847 [Gautieria morchelliformis]|nr:hypothetical protein JB92DRAFT_3139847 [Gautieria morchelliformis]